MCVVSVCVSVCVSECSYMLCGCVRVLACACVCMCHVHVHVHVTMYASPHRPCALATRAPQRYLISHCNYFVFNPLAGFHSYS